MKPDHSRYQKQIRLKELGEFGQQRLSEARVLVLGAGGLGCPALQYLAAAGIGHIGIVDFDVVEASNLHRQVLYTPADIGKFKATVATERVRALNPDIAVETFNLKIDTQNALDLIARFDLVIDGTDNFPTRYMINDACVLLGKPLVYGAVFRFEGQLSVFNWSENGIKTNYRDLFPTPPDPGEVANCDEAGVIGVLPGIIGTMQANEAIKILTGMGKSLANRLLTFNALNNSLYELDMVPLQESELSIPKTAEEFQNRNYEWFCNNSEDRFKHINGREFEQMLREKDPLILDVRNLWETPQPTEFEYLRIPLADLAANLHQLKTAQPIIVFCQTGVRSITAANMIAQGLGNAFVYNLKGGITQWKRKQ